MTLRRMYNITSFDTFPFTVLELFAPPHDELATELKLSSVELITTYYVVDIQNIYAGS